MSPAGSRVGIFPRKREVPPPRSGRGPDSLISLLLWTADALKVVGCAMGDHVRTSLVCQATDMAVRRCPVEEGVTVLAARTGEVSTRLKGSWTAWGPT